MGSNNSGYYQLQAVLTHQGRSSSSGHYVGWVKRKEGMDSLIKISLKFNAFKTLLLVSCLPRSYHYTGTNKIELALHLNTSNSCIFIRTCSLLFHYSDLMITSIVITYHNYKSLFLILWSKIILLRCSISLRQVVCTLFKVSVRTQFV